MSFKTWLNSHFVTNYKNQLGRPLSYGFRIGQKWYGLCDICRKPIKFRAGTQGLKENKNYIKIISKKLKKEFRIYEWENKAFKSFPMPKGFTWCKYIDFIFLYDNNLIEMEKYPIVYYVKNQSEKSIKNGWGLSWLFLARDLGLYSRNERLEDSDSGGRVVVVRKLKEKK